MMAGKSSIEWTEQTWNPIVGCSIVSPGCTNCYAMKMAARIEAMSEAIYDTGKRTAPAQYCGTTKKVNGNAVWTGRIAFAGEDTLRAPLQRKKPTTYFVNSMGDLFHEDCPNKWIDCVFAVMALCPQHIFQVLTKRAARMRDYFDLKGSIADSYIGRVCGAIDELMPWRTDESRDARTKIAMGHPLPNIWLGVSAERQQEADERIPLLLQTPAAVRFISAEPLLGPIDLMGLVAADRSTITDALQGCIGRDAGNDSDGRPEWEGCQPCAKLDWVIVGGESGREARPMHPDWARRLHDQCKAAGVPFFFKQWGDWSPTGSGNHPVTRIGEGLHEYQLIRLGKKAAGRLLDGIEYNGMPR